MSVILYLASPFSSISSVRTHPPVLTWGIMWAHVIHVSWTMECHLTDYSYCVQYLSHLLSHSWNYYYHNHISTPFTNCSDPHSWLQNFVYTCIINNTPHHKNVYQYWLYNSSEQLYFKIKLQAITSKTWLYSPAINRTWLRPPHSAAPLLWSQWLCDRSIWQAVLGSWSQNSSMDPISLSCHHLLLTAIVKSTMLPDWQLLPYSTMALSEHTHTVSLL